jgi:hypothetical protein
MNSKPILLKRTFDDVYGLGNNPTVYAGKQYIGSGISPSANNIYVNNCVFRYCSSSSAGGAIYCGSSVYKFLVEQSSFLSCRTAGNNGGAIYFYSSTSGECVLSRTCGYNCSSTYTSTSEGQFANIYTKSDISYKSHVNDSSVTRYSKNTSSSYNALYFKGGNILCPSINLTNNECYGNTAIYCYPVSSSISDTFRMSYSSIVNNTANPGSGCILHDNSGSSHCIDTCNIINNQQTSSGLGTIRANTKVFIKNSCILGNNIGKYVFYTSSYSITISNCTIDDNSFVTGRYYGTITVNKTIEIAFINALTHIATQNCDSYFDSYGTLTVKPNCHCECPRFIVSCNIKYPMIDPIRSIKFILLLTMLPSDPANDNYFNSNCIFL